MKSNLELTTLGVPGFPFAASQQIQMIDSSLVSLSLTLINQAS